MLLQSESQILGQSRTKILRHSKVVEAVQCGMQTLCYLLMALWQEQEAGILQDSP